VVVSAEYITISVSKNTTIASKEHNIVIHINTTFSVYSKKSYLLATTILSSMIVYLISHVEVDRSLHLC